MKYKTLKKMEKAVKMIEGKGYDRETANEIAIKRLDMAETVQNGQSVEWWVSSVADRETWEKEATA